MRFLSLVSEKDFFNELSRIGASPKEFNGFKADTLFLKLEGIPPSLSNILKNAASSFGSECIIGKKRREKTDLLLIGQGRAIEGIASLLPSEIGAHLRALLKRSAENNFVLKFKEHTYNLKERVFIMGILNVTPDSFFNGGKYSALDKAIDRAYQMAEEGADLIDIGGESTRPGSLPVSEKTEIKRVLPVIKELKKRLKIPLSIDTYKSSVAKLALKEGCEIVNDISGLSFDKEMASVVALFNAYCVIMHIKGKPRTMQKRVVYSDLMKEVYQFLAERISFAKKMGIEEEKIILDPGIGFGKLLEHNYQLIRRVREFKSLGRPILLGLSRKSFIGQTLSLPVSERLFGSVAAAVVAVIQGANILRVHDVKETKEATRMAEAIMRC